MDLPKKLRIDPLKIGEVILIAAIFENVAFLAIILLLKNSRSRAVLLGEAIN